MLCIAKHNKSLSWDFLEDPEYGNFWKRKPENAYGFWEILDAQWWKKLEISGSALLGKARIIPGTGAWENLEATNLRLW